jgi:two-component system, OmpR family, phosphate regulon sensor histidine kinase PhoR
MAAIDQRGEAGREPGSWWLRLTSMRAVLIAAALVLFGFVMLGALTPGYALSGFAILLAVAVIGRRAGQWQHVAPVVSEPSKPLVGNPLIDAVISGLPDPVIVLGRDGRVVAFNERARAIAPALSRGEPASLALRVPEIVEAIRRAAASGEVQRVEFSERVPVDRWFAAHVAPVELEEPARGFDGGLMMMTFHDLTPLRRVEEMRADFVANASHELRTPLASLSGFIDTLQGPARDDPPARDRFIGIMKQQANRMARLIDDLLSLSRIELNAHLYPQTPVDLVSIVRQVADSLQMLARDRDMTITIKAPAEPLIVPGDRDELTRVFENLVENALKYGATGKRVDLTLSRAETAPGVGEALVAVRDYGPGISAEHLPRLTERFYRIDVGHSRAEGGTGLGLALVKHILARHRGRLVIDSSAGAGATFTVRMPLAAIRARALNQDNPII